jgi:diadenosine tetraphosphate (Ap4A) HIT family hydrolase
MATEMTACELCSRQEVLLENALAYVRYDSNSLSRGHVLVIPKRHVADFFDMTRNSILPTATTLA